VLLVDNGIAFEYKNIADKLKENTNIAKECLGLLEKYNAQRNSENIDLIQERLRKIICVEDVVIPIIIDGIEEQKRKLMKLKRVEDTI